MNDINQEKLKLTKHGCGNLIEIVLKAEEQGYGDDIIKYLNLEGKKETMLMKKTMPKTTDFRDVDFFLFEYGIKCKKFIIASPLKGYYFFKKWINVTNRKKFWNLILEDGCCFIHRKSMLKINSKDKESLLEFIDKEKS